MRKGQLMASGDPQSVLTKQHLKQAFEFDMDVIAHPLLPISFCLPRWIVDDHDQAAR